MQKPLQITWRHMEPSESLEEQIQREVEELQNICPDMISCHVVVETDHNQPNLSRNFRVGIDLTVPDKEIAIAGWGPKDAPYEDAYVALRDSFDNAERKIHQYSDRRHHHVKRHNTNQ